MYLGKIVELGPADEVYSNPIHPYTLSLLSAAADPRSEGERGARAAGARGRPAEPGQPAGGLPLPHPLPLRDRDLLRGRAGARRTTGATTGPPATTHSTASIPKPCAQCLPRPSLRPAEPGDSTACKARGARPPLTFTLAMVLVFTEAVLLARGRVVAALALAVIALPVLVFAARRQRNS